VDLDADGHMDILSGSYAGGAENAGLFQVLRGRSDRSFSPAAVLRGTDHKPLVIPNDGNDDVVRSICTRPTAADWDGDGDLDLVVGNFAGTFYLFTGEGAGKFEPKPQQLLSGDSPLKVEHHGDPFVVDWDADGDHDLLSGAAKGGVWWAENTAGAKKVPALKPFAALIAAPAEVRGECRPNEVAVPDGSTRVWAADVNADGKLDILVGDCIALISPLEGVSEGEFTSRYATWKDEMAALDRELANATQPDFARWGELLKRRAEFISEDRTGFVWLYLQK
jgi:hypothetical protein